MTKEKPTCKYWVWDKEHPKASCLDIPYKKCYKCKECLDYSDYVAEKMAGLLK